MRSAFTQLVNNRSPQNSRDSAGEAEFTLNKSMGGAQAKGCALHMFLVTSLKREAAHTHAAFPQSVGFQVEQTGETDQVKWGSSWSEVGAGDYAEWSEANYLIPFRDGV